MANQDFYDFDEALDRLGLEAEELKRLVSEGEIRAFRDGDSMRLRAEDVEGLRRGIDEGAFLEDDAEDMTEELVFEDGLGDDDLGMATTQLSEEETLLEEEVDLADVGEFEGMEDLDDDLELPDEGLSASASGGTRIQRTRSRTDQLKEQEEAKQAPLFIAISVLTALIALIFGLSSAIDASAGSKGPVSKWWAENIGKAFAGSDIPETRSGNFGEEQQ